MAHEQELKVEPNDGGLVNPNAVQGSEETESGPRTSPDNLESSTFDWKASSNTKLAFTSICILALMAALDGTSIGVALPAIAKALNGTAIESFWSGTSFLLSSTVLQPCYVAFSNMFGRRNMLLFAILFFFAGALICCVSKKFTALLVGRSIQGAGAGGILSLSEVLITDLVPLQYRGDYYGGINAMWAVGSVLGPVVGGGFSGNERATWRWIFYINFPFIGAGTIFVLLFMRLQFVPKPLLSQLRSFDWIGMAIFLASTTSFLLGLTWGGVLYAWNSYQTLVPLILGACGCVAFACYEAYLASTPLIPLVLFQNRTTVVSYFGTVITGLVLWCILYYMPLYFEAVQGYSPLISGVALFPQSFTVAPVGAVTGALIVKTGKYRWAIWLGWFVGTFGLGLYCVLEVGTSIPGWIFLNLVSGLGLGFLFPGIATAVQASVASEHAAIAIAMFSFFRSAGQALGVAVGGVVFQNRMEANLLTYPDLAPLAKNYSADAAALIEILRAMPEGSEKQDLKHAYVDSFRVVWTVCCALGGVAMLISLFTRHHSLDQNLATDQGIIESKKVGDSGSGEDGHQA